MDIIPLGTFILHSLTSVIVLTRSFLKVQTPQGREPQHVILVNKILSSHRSRSTLRVWVG